MSTNLYRMLALALFVVCLSGCSRGVRWPNLWHPGPVGYQQHAALYHDPYPLDDVAPEIVGGRPLAYQRPIPEAVRNQPVCPPPTRAGYPWR